MNENVKIFIIATLVIAFVLFLPSLIESAKLLSPEAGFADEKAAEEILDDKSNNETQPILEDDEKEQETEEDQILPEEEVPQEVMPADEFDMKILPDDDN